MKRVRDLASTKMSVNSRRARVACVIPSRLSSTSSRRALHAIHELDQGPTRPRHGTTLLQSLRLLSCNFLGLSPFYFNEILTEKKKKQTTTSFPSLSSLFGHDVWEFSSITFF
ncbi:unnamed protein product [Brassica napus]|uniref:(rape) hypothetical protein n=1 Tax=Brassica napus TaxID=3708 RepID=A0A816SZJ3_BRANA|nr:unnamed protein product [Brassica napus]